MKIRKLSKAVALSVLMLGAVAANAATDRDAVQACSEAIATNVEKRQGSTVKLTIDLSAVSTKRRLINDTLFHLDAINPATDHVIGRFDCRVDRRAIVRSLKRLPPDAPDAKVRAAS